MHPDLAEYARLFDAGRFWDAHEALEPRWLEDRDPFLQGLIQLAAVFVHLEKGKPDAARGVLSRARGHLARAAEGAFGVDVAAVRAFAAALDVARPVSPVMGALLTRSTARGTPR